MEDRKLIPNAIGKVIEFQSTSSYKGEHFYHITLSNGSAFALVSSTPIEVYRSEDLE